jgi:hypothetical protein
MSSGCQPPAPWVAVPVLGRFRNLRGKLNRLALNLERADRFEILERNKAPRLSPLSTDHDSSMMSTMPQIVRSVLPMAYVTV